jgi:hypothetical protein
MQIRESDAKTSAGQYIFNAKWNDSLVALPGEGNLATNILAVIAQIGEDQKHCPAGINCVGDLVVERPAGSNISRRNPATRTTPFQFVNDLHRGIAIFRNMADEKKAFRIGHFGSLGIGSPRRTPHCEQENSGAKSSFFTLPAHRSPNKISAISAIFHAELAWLGRHRDSLSLETV